MFMRHPLFRKIKKPTKGFLVDEVTKEVLRFQYNPSELSISRQPTWASIVVPGLSNPKVQFINGGDHKVSFKLDFYHDGQETARIAKVIAFIESLTYPDFGANAGLNMRRGAHPVLFNLGEFFVNMRCYVSNYTAKPEYLFDPKTMLPLKASIDIELTEMMYEGSGKNTFRSNTYQRVRNRHGALK